MISLLQDLQFGTPLALLGLFSLPLLWWLLRFTPPRPRQLRFPPLRILLSLPSQEETPDKTPWWLLLLRLALAALLIFAVAQPFIQPKGAGLLPSGHRLIILDNGWGAAGQWATRRDLLLDLLKQARDASVPVSIAVTAPSLEPLPIVQGAARDALNKARLLKPSPLGTDRSAALKHVREAKLGQIGSIIWLADGLGPESAAEFAAGLQQLAPDAKLLVHTPGPRDLPLALGPMTIDGNEIKLPLLSPPDKAGSSAIVSVRATNGRTLHEVPVKLAASGTTPASFVLPSALRNEIQFVALAGQDHAGARQLFDDRWRRRSIALQANVTAEQAQPLLSPLHYLRRGLEPFAELYEPADDAELQALIEGGLSMLVMSDIGTLEPDKERRLSQWVERGGIVVRFAGPRLAAGGDSLLPVKLREGDRSLGSALSWDVPQGLAPFPENSPFAGLVPDPVIRVTRQILAEPDLEIANRTWASLEDGTPLVTAERRGKGLIVLFHVTSNANWSNLPLSGLFLEMLQRVAGLDPSSATATGGSSEADYAPRLVLNGSGDLASTDGSAQPIPAKDIDKAVASLIHPPGLYAKQGREFALNLKLTASDLRPMPQKIPGAQMRSYAAQPRQDFSPYLFALAALLFLIDTFATLLIGGGFSRRPAVTATLLILLLLPVAPWSGGRAHAQDVPPVASQREIAAALEARLAFVETGDADIDRASAQGLAGLTYYLTERTSATLAEPHGVRIERDDITFYPLLYWPVREQEEPLSAEARTKLAAYMRNGGMVFFDTRAGGLDLDGGGNSGLRTLLQGLDLPPLEPVPDQHVLTRSFYLLDRFPGRFEGPRPWVESMIGESSSDPGTADGVSSVIIGSNDYAAAWAIDDYGMPLYAVVPGSDRQREFAMRVGINAVMYALTGNYKADQVHVPAFLERLGQ